MTESKTPKPDLKIKSSNNKAPAVETGPKQPSHQIAIEYIDGIMQNALCTRAEHITGQRALQQLAMAIHRLKEQPTLLEMDKEVGKANKEIEKLKKQIVKLKGK